MLDVLIIPDVAPEVLEGVEEEAALFEAEFQPLILSVDEYLSEVVGLFADTLSLVASTPILRFFAVFAVFLAVFGLALRFIGAGKILAR